MAKESFVEFVGKNIASRRHQLKYTQEFLAEKVGVTQDTISRVENGTTPPKFEKLPDYAVALDCSVLDLFRTLDNDTKEYAATFVDMICDLPPKYQKKLMSIVAEVATMIKT